MFGFGLKATEVVQHRLNLVLPVAFIGKFHESKPFANRTVYDIVQFLQTERIIVMEYRHLLPV